MKRPRAAIAFVITCSLLVTCGVSSASPARDAAVDRAVMTSAPFPLSVNSGDGTVRIPARPDRILSLSASATQMLYEIGAGSQVVGVDEYSTWPANAPRTKFSGDESSAEDYLYLRPDLVIFAFSSGTLIKQLQKLKIPVLLLPPAATIANVDSQLAELGTATGNEAGAKNVQSSFKADIAAAVGTAGGHGRGATYYLELDPTNYYTATSGTFIGAEFSLFGMRDIADAAGHGSQYPQISPEYILKENPDYVFLADTVCCGANAANFARRPGFSVLKAVRLNHVVGLNDSVASQWGPHTMETFVSLLARVLHTGAPSS
ncbi:MAG TPA: ABC transporter substrate-binding protein [Acidimicrobiales bacterium]|nr:ABC transporter substrate-binding protein [Acidimicrobiales bacterium]